MHRLLLIFCIFFASALSAAADQIVMFRSCDLVASPHKLTNAHTYGIIGDRTLRAAHLCAVANPKKCVTLKLYKFDINCNGRTAAWWEIALRLAQDGGVKLANSEGQELILSTKGQDLIIRSPETLPHGERINSQLPKGYAPLTEMGAHIQHEQLRQQQYSYVSGTPFQFISSARASEPVVMRKAVPFREGVINKVAQFASPTTIYDYGAERRSGQRSDQTIVTAQNSVSSLAGSLQHKANATLSGGADLSAGVHNIVSSGGHWSAAAAGTNGIGTLGTNYSVQQNMIATILVLALMTSLASGIGWFATQHILTLRARKSDPYQVILRRQFTDLARPDAQMCGELIRTCHALVDEIQVRTSEIQGAAPLRRVLLREVKSMEQFLITTTRALPDDPREWRRMRLRLQRVVTDLIRLKDIADSARRSLTTRITTDELPRDVQEAYEVLGANPEASERILKRLVDALRATWHPDLATNDDDRAMRDRRIRQINVAWDLITKKRIE